jgi:hypothetical protein
MSIMQHNKTLREAATTNTINSEAVIIWTANRREDSIPQYITTTQYGQLTEILRMIVLMKVQYCVK